MRKSNTSYKILFLVLLSSLLTLAGCSKEKDNIVSERPTEMQEINTQSEESATEKFAPTIEIIADESKEKVDEPPIVSEIDWSDYFAGINGAAVIYDSTENCYLIYNQELADTRRSPCSTFKIISSLIALENGVIKVDDSTRTWSGEVFWNEDWNRDIDFTDAFHASCVWYFREVIDEIGKNTMQEELNRLQYGNCDISDWEGRLNTNNSNPALTGFWVESSLLISPKEQTGVIERIFGDDTDYSEKTIKQLEQVMLLSQQNEAGISIYGKTGMGKAHGSVVDAWFTGFADTGMKRISFCVYLGETDDKTVSSATAREIAIKIVSDYLN